jgi:hypothetical protein
MLSPDEQMYYDRTVISAARSSSGYVWVMKTNKVLMRLLRHGLLAISVEPLMDGWWAVSAADEEVDTYAGPGALMEWRQRRQREAIYLLGGDVVASTTFGRGTTP